MKSLFDDISYACSKHITQHYSTSFSLGIRLLSPKVQKHIYNIYGYVRLADEVVDSFHDYPQEEILDRLEKETYQSIEQKISLNPILNSFQYTVNLYDIDFLYIAQFLHSMNMDLKPKEYDEEMYKEYIVGSAEAVGLMCLQVFVEGDKEKFEHLKPYAESLGSVFQKVNFLRDIQYDYSTLNRTYFPNIEMENISEQDLETIFKDIQGEFEHALEGIKKLPDTCKFGVFLAYRYYYKLFKKIERTAENEMIEKRVRIPNTSKMIILLKSLIRHQLKWY